MLSANMAMAQNTRFTLTGGWSFPMGEFAQSDLASNQWGLATKGPWGGAGQGGMLGVQWCRPMSDYDHLSLLLSFDFIYNDMGSDIKTSLFETRKALESNFSEVKFTLPGYINLPLMAGLRYEWPTTNGRCFFVEAQAGADCLIVTDRGATLRDGQQPLVIQGQTLYDYIYTDHYTTTVAVAFHLGVGYRFAWRWQFDAGLWYLGSHQISGVEDYSVNTHPYPADLTDGKQNFLLEEINPIMITTRIGFKL